ncbi:MAG TPA: type II CAAX endopeptidase family protein [Flavobacteriaceae bacterium]|nr:type II CAAX endopeptidase family protein [Flavobacteriaceae bacterium]
MFIENGFKGLHRSWMYLVGSILTFFASQIGGVFLLFMVAMQLTKEGRSVEEATNQNVLMSTLDSNLTLFLMLLGFVFGLIGLFLIVRYLHKQKIKDLTTTRSKVDFRRIVFGFLLVSIPAVVLTLIGYIISPEDYIVQFDLYPFLILFVIVIIFIPIQTSFEEYIFRGYLMQGIGVNTKSRFAALLITSVVFGLLHIANPEVEKLGYFVMVYYIGTGLFLGLITLMDEGMELALGYHAGNNIIAALLVSADWTAFQTNSILKDISEPSVVSEVVLGVFVLFPIFYIILSKKYNWTGFREKVFGKVQEPKVEIEEAI